MCNYVIRTTVDVHAIGGIMCLLGGRDRYLGSEQFSSDR